MKLDITEISLSKVTDEFISYLKGLDDAEELLQGFDGVLKVGVAGPWTLAACVERFAGDRLLADHGARRELAQALAAGAEDLRGELSRRVPAATCR